MSIDITKRPLWSKETSKIKMTTSGTVITVGWLDLFRFSRWAVTHQSTLLATCHFQKRNSYLQQHFPCRRSSISANSPLQVQTCKSLPQVQAFTLPSPSGTVNRLHASPFNFKAKKWIGYLPHFTCGDLSFPRNKGLRKLASYWQTGLVFTVEISTLYLVCLNYHLLCIISYLFVARS